MWRVDPRRFRGMAALAASVALAVLVGASPAKKKGAEPPPPTVEEAVGDLAIIASQTETRLEGVGLVVGLDDTGVDPPASFYRQRLVDDLRKAGVESANELLKNPKVTMVIVHMNVPAGVTPSDRLDVEIEVPPGGGTRSLAGGYLLQTRLREVMVLGGMPKEGQDAAFAQGPVMTGSQKKPDDLKAGRVLGGGRVRKEIPFQVVLKENRKSFRTASLTETVINQRFPHSDGVEQKGCATAKTDQYLVLKVPAIYHQNQDRYFRVLKLLPLVDNPPLRVARQEQWGKALLDPATAGIAALRLEGMGASASDTLEAALKNPNAQVRFLAAEALAYLGNASGAEVLADTVINLPQFRAPALAALASTDQSAFHMKLRKLMDQPDVEVRYGAFNALRTLAGDDYFLGQVRVLDDPPADEDDQEMKSDDLAVAIGAGTRRRPRQEDPFTLYVVDCEGPPMVHVSRTRRCEVVIFGRGAQLQTPVVLGTGAIQLNAADGDRSIEISKIVASRLSDADEKVSSSLDLAEVLRRTANVGASYPEIVSILQAADRQKNLPGPLVVDAVPAMKPEYLAAALLGQDTTVKKDPAVAQTKGAGPPARRGLLRWFGRPAPAPSKSDEAAPPQPRTASDFVAPGGPSQAPESIAPGNRSAKKDDAVVPTSGQTTEPAPAPAPEAPRGFLGRLRHRLAPSR